MDESVMPPSDAERWLPVVGWEDLYEVSDLGRVRSLPRMIWRAGTGWADWKPYRGKLLKPIFRDPYYHAHLADNGRRRYARIHVLVAEAFIGPRPEGYEVCHGPNGQQDNSLANLCYGTKSKNMGEDKRRDGSFPVGERHSRSKLTEAIVIQVRARAKAGEARYALAREFGVSPSTIYSICYGKNWRHVPFPDAAQPPAA